MLMEWRKNSFFIVFILLLLGPCRAFAEGPIDENEWEELRKELSYEEKQPEEKQTDSVSPFLYGFLATLFSSGIMVFGSILVLALIGFLVYILIKHSKGASFRMSSKSAEEIKPVEPDSQSSFEDLWKAFNKAKSQGNYRECIRLIHQICIKNLSEAGLLQLHPDKTNWEYVSDLNSPVLANDFSKLTAEHELIWYGDSHLDEKGFIKLETEFNDFLKSEELG